MKPISIGEFLGSQRRKHEESIAAGSVVASLEGIETQPVVDEQVKHVEKEWYARGHEAGLREGRAAARDELQKSMRDQSEGTQREVVEHLMLLRTAIRREIAQARSELEQRLSQAIGALFRSVVTDRTQKELCTVTRKMLNTSGIETVTISASGETISLLQSRLSDLENYISYIETDTAEAVITFDQTMIRTQIDAWASKIEEIVATGASEGI